MAATQAAWPIIPKDAIEYFRRAFAEANRVATEHIVNVPNIRETSLDDVLVNALIPFSPPQASSFRGRCANGHPQYRRS
jgi:hypothetical protein